MLHQELQPFLTRTKDQYLSTIQLSQMIFALLLAFTLFAGSFLLNSQPAQAAAMLSYSCGSSSGSGHCYGWNTWVGAVDGSATQITVRGITGGNGFIDNEMWLVQWPKNGLPRSTWVEAGYISDSGFENGAEVWFWADSRPQDNGYVNLHYGIPLRSGDYGHNVAITLKRKDSCSFTASVVGVLTGEQGTSTNNCISPDHIQIGQELAGSNGANAPKALYSQNEYEAAGRNYFSYQFQDGSGSGKNPPWAGWDQNHRPSNSGGGGTWYTCTLPSSGGNPC
jgi:hypothetical protein